MIADVVFFCLNYALFESILCNIVKTFLNVLDIFINKSAHKIKHKHHKRIFNFLSNKKVINVY